MKFLLDHNFAPRHAEMLRFYDIPAHHLRDAFPGVIKDVDWIPLLAGTDWVIVTCDQHIQTRKAEARALRNSGASAIFINPFFANLSLIKKGEWLLRHWPEIMARAEAEIQPFYFQLQHNGTIKYIKF